MLFGTGIRRSELISLNMASLDGGRQILSVRGKGDKMREIPLVGTLYAEILLYLKAAGYMLKAGSGSDTPLLRTPKGLRLYPVYVDRAVKEELADAEGFTGRKSPHVLRHTIASELLDEGTDLNSIKELLGHSSLAATQVYTHNTIERLKKVYDNAHPRANKNGGKNGDQD
jgi:integrase/recombinase XerC